MKILVFSDTHRRIGAITDVLINSNYDSVIFLGDVEDDILNVASFYEGDIYSVCGNNDFFSSEPTERFIQLEDVKIFMCHGHTVGVKYGKEKLISEAKKRGADMALFGHTHEPCDDYIDAIRVLNPGSAGFYPATYAEIEINGKDIKSRIISLA